MACVKCGSIDDNCENLEFSGRVRACICPDCYNEVMEELLLTKEHQRFMVASFMTDWVEAGAANLSVQEARELCEEYVGATIQMHYTMKKILFPESAKGNSYDD